MSPLGARELELRGAIVAAPDDDAPRLAFAEWLRAQGRVGEAESLRLRLALARDPGPAEEHRLRAQLAARAAADKDVAPPPLPAGLVATRSERGFAVSLTVGRGATFAGVREAMTLLPIRALHGGDPLAELCAAAGDDWPPRLRELSFTRAASARSLRRALESRALLTAQRLALEVSDPSALRAVVEVEAPSVSDLDLVLLAGYRDLLTTLAAARVLERLTRLRLRTGSERPSEESVRALASAPLGGLTSLEWRFAKLGDDLAAALLAAPWVAGLTHLDLHHDELGPRAAAALARSAPRLERLSLGEDPIGDEGLRAMAEGGVLSTLRALSLAGCALTDASALGAARAPSLDRLDLRGNRLGDAAVEAASGLSGQLRFLGLGALDREGVCALAASPRFASLEHLEIPGSRLGDDGAIALAGSEHLRRLAVLEIHDRHSQGPLTPRYYAHGVGPAGIAAMTASGNAGVRRLTEHRVEPDGRAVAPLMPAVEARVLAPKRADEARARALVEGAATPYDAWQQLAELVPAELRADARRRFVGPFLLRCESCGGTGRDAWTEVCYACHEGFVERGDIELDHPPSIAACVAVAADAESILAAEALARDVAAGLGLAPDRVRWQVLVSDGMGATQHRPRAPEPAIEALSTPHLARGHRHWAEAAWAIAELDGVSPTTRPLEPLVRLRALGYLLLEIGEDDVLLALSASDLRDLRAGRPD